VNDRRQSPPLDRSLNRILAALCRFISRHEEAIDNTAEATLCILVALEGMLPRCSRENCDCAATRYHAELDIKACDKCYEDMRVGAIKRMSGDMDDPTNVLRFATVKEDLWSELPNAENVRRIIAYVDVIKTGTTCQFTPVDKSKLQ
jgi:hypothetical protein